MNVKPCLFIISRVAISAIELTGYIHGAAYILPSCPHGSLFKLTHCTWDTIRTRLLGSYYESCDNDFSSDLALLAFLIQLTFKFVHVATWVFALSIGSCCIDASWMIVMWICFPLRIWTNANQVSKSSSQQIITTKTNPNHCVFHCSIGNLLFVQLDFQIIFYQYMLDWASFPRN